MAKTFKLEIITPHQTVQNDDVVHVKAPGKQGSFGVLVNHVPYIGSLSVGQLEVKATSGTERFATSGGFTQVVENVMTILVEAVERADEIDVERAKAARDRALERLKGDQDDIDLKRARRALRRAENRLEVAAAN